MASVCTINGGTALMMRGLRRPALAVAGQEADHLTAAGGVPDVDGVMQVEMFDQGGEIVGVVVEVVAAGGLGGPAVPAAVVGDDAVALRQEEQHLVVPVVGGQRPAVAEHDRLTLCPSPCRRSRCRRWW